MKNYILNHFSSFINKLIDESVFWKYYFQNPFCIEDTYIDHFNRTALRAGASRGCLVDKNFEYVVKFDFPEERESASCDEEVRIYSLAEKEGLERFFAEPIFVGFYNRKINFYDYHDINMNMSFCPYDEDEFAFKLQDLIDDKIIERKEIEINIPLYAYPTCFKLNFFASDKDVNTFLSNENERSPLMERDIKIGINFIKDYGEEEFNKLSNFLLENNVNDLHTGNVMKRKNGDLVLTDYCGYRI